MACVHGEVPDDARLARQQLCARHVGVGLTVRGDAVDHRVVEDDALFEPRAEARQRPLAPIWSHPREVARAHVLTDRVAVEGHVVGVDQAEWRTGAGTEASSEAAVQELRKVDDRATVVRDPRLGEAEADVAQPLHALGQLHEGSAPGHIAERAHGGHRIAVGQHPAVLQHAVDLIRAAGQPPRHVLYERAAAGLRQHYLAPNLRERRHKHGTEEAASADADSFDGGYVNLDAERREGSRCRHGRATPSVPPGRNARKFGRLQLKSSPVLVKFGPVCILE